MDSFLLLSLYIIYHRASDNANAGTGPYSDAERWLTEIMILCDLPLLYLTEDGCKFGDISLGHLSSD
jgi:hypothetical protein